MSAANLLRAINLDPADWTDASSSSAFTSATQSSSLPIPVTPPRMSCFDMKPDAVLLNLNIYITYFRYLSNR